MSDPRSKEGSCTDEARCIQIEEQVIQDWETLFCCPRLWTVTVTGFLNSNIRAIDEVILVAAVRIRSAEGGTLIEVK